VTGLRTWLRLGRVSNLPTVWSNVLTGILLGGSEPVTLATLALLVAMTLYYEAGMFLNDACDAEIDRRERPDRPIPSGIIAAGTVFAAGFSMLGLAVLIVVGVSTAVHEGSVWTAILSAIALAAAILAYDRFHKDNPLSPLLMGLCRVLVYVTSALCAAGSLSLAVLVAAGALLSYLIGLTYTAKHESGQSLTRYWPLLFLAVPFVAAGGVIGESDAGTFYFLLLLAWVAYSLRYIIGPARNIRLAVGHLIAGIALLDALLIAANGHPGWAIAGVVAFLLTLALQRHVPGT